MRRVIAFLLSMLTLVSSVGISQNVHYCGGIAMEHSLSLGFEDLHCGMADMPLACTRENDSKPSINSEPCCSNEHMLFQLDENTTKQAPIELNINGFFAALQPQSIESVFLIETIVPRIEPRGSPPLFKQDFRILFDSFLI